MKHKLGTLVIQKKLFIEIIKSLKWQYEHDHKCIDAFNVILPDDRVMGYSNETITFQLISLLKLAFDDDTDGSWIDYFIYDMDFGKDYKEGCVLDKHTKPIPLKSIDDLWNLLHDKD